MRALCFVTSVSGFNTWMDRDICPDPDESLMCTNDCIALHGLCVDDCNKSDDQRNCSVLCNENLLGCVKDCPCLENCPNGCTDCPYCQCTDIEDDEEFQFCEQHFEAVFFSCINDCHHDPDCMGLCNRDFSEDLLKCPCQEKCPAGCPCPEYTCLNQPTTTNHPTTTTAPQQDMNILTLGWKSQSLTIDANDVVNSNAAITFRPATESYYSCALTHRNRHFVFGGSSQKRQISELIGCKLVRVADLSFDLYGGACTVDNMDSMMLCFHNSATQDCWKSQDIDKPFVKLNKSVYTHQYTSIASNEATGQIFAMGHHNSHNHAELYDTSMQKWTDTTDYPFEQKIGYYALASVGDAFYIFGGYGTSNQYLQTVARFRPEHHEWRQLGFMNHGRYGHGAIVRSGHVYVIGGIQAQKTELCTLKVGSVTCELLEPSVSNYYYSPNSFLVDPTFNCQ